MYDIKTLFALNIKWTEKLTGRKIDLVNDDFPNPFKPQVAEMNIENLKEEEELKNVE